MQRTIIHLNARAIETLKTAITAKLRDPNPRTEQEQDRLESMQIRYATLLREHATLESQYRLDNFALVCDDNIIEH